MLRITTADGPLQLSLIGLGCWTLSGRWWGPDQDDARAIRVIHEAIDHGVNWVDTAPLYGHGHGDALVRSALADRPGVHIATKVGVRIDGEHAHSALDATFIVADAEASLRRLGRDVIDVLAVHWPCEAGTPLAETVGALEGLRARGLIRAWGLCNYSLPEVALAAQLGPVASLQAPLSMVRREAEATLLPGLTALSPPVPLVAYETLARGLLSGRFARPPRFSGDDLRQRDPRFSGPRFWATRDLLDGISAVAAKIDVPVPALAVGWALRRPGVGAALVGARQPGQLPAALRALELLDRQRLWSVVDRLVDAAGEGAARG